MLLVLLQVTLGQKKGQAMRVVSRCLWDTHSDSSASELYENETLYCVCQVSDVGFACICRLYSVFSYAHHQRSGPLTKMFLACRCMACTMSNLTLYITNLCLCQDNKNKDKQATTVGP